MLFMASTNCFRTSNEFLNFLSWNRAMFTSVVIPSVVLLISLLISHFQLITNGCYYFEIMF